MGFFKSGAANTPPPTASYNILDGSDNSLPRGPRSAHPAPPAPPLSAQYNPPQIPYNDPSSAFFEKPSHARKAPPRSGGRHVLATIDIVPITNMSLLIALPLQTLPVIFLP